MAYLLDTSAWLAHLFGETGLLKVRQVFNEPQSQVFVSALSLIEVHARLKSLHKEKNWPAIYKDYAALFAKILPVDEQVTRVAIQLRAATPARLPTIDALIAATALAHNLTLVHRDAHLALIPDEILHQVRLPEK